jgi:hypothetical protein
MGWRAGGWVSRWAAWQSRPAYAAPLGLLAARLPQVQVSVNICIPIHLLSTPGRAALPPAAAALALPGARTVRSMRAQVVPASSSSQRISTSRLAGPRVMMTENAPGTHGCQGGVGVIWAPAIAKFVTNARPIEALRVFKSLAFMHAAGLDDKRARQRLAVNDSRLVFVKLGPAAAVWSTCCKSSLWKTCVLALVTRPILLLVTGAPPLRCFGEVAHSARAEWHYGVSLTQAGTFPAIIRNGFATQTKVEATACPN